MPKNKTSETISAREIEMDAGLSEIYQDESGKLVNVSNMAMRKGRGLLGRFALMLGVLTLLIGSGWYGYQYYLNSQAQKNDTVSLSIEGEKSFVAGQPLTYTIKYKNLGVIAIKNINITATYPDNFVVEKTEPKADNSANNSWQINELLSRRSDEIKIVGRVIGETGQSSAILAKMVYQPANFSSQFSQEASFNQSISTTGITISVNPPTGVFLTQPNSLLINYQAEVKNFITSFRVVAMPIPGVVYGTTSPSSTEPTYFTIANVTDKQASLTIPFTVMQRPIDSAAINLRFEYSPDGKQYYAFLQKNLTLDILSRSLNVGLFINATSTDQGVNFAQPLNYSITYANKGDIDLHDVIVMAVIDSDFVDWPTLDDKNQGVVDNGKITWNKDSIPALADIAPGTSGSIDFVVNVMSAKEIDPSRNYQVKSYARFTIGTSTAPTNDDDKSNVITNKINSDLKLSEEVRYYNDDNIAVGYGPIPPKVGQTTSYKVYWHLSNNLNELNGVKIETTLPSYVNWDAKNRADVGTIQFDAATRKVIWTIGRLPITVYKAEAEFNINITPVADDQNKVLVLLPGSTIEGVDVATNSQIKKTLNGKTTKLVDDAMITDDGLIQ
ncbi:MAG: hypothetical protein WCK11_04480 [Candidatus Falkowbacteria bacterium]